jgi:tRNA pseudouridine38-40 synthase
LRYSLLVAYDGTDFHGWQKQAGLRTVQGDLEQAVQMVVREQCNVVGASRTDAGVHALGQVAAFSADTRLAPRKLAAALNARLPDDIRVRRAAEVPEGFSPISEAIAKGYRYRMLFGANGTPTRPLFGRRTTFWTPYALDPVAMNLAARRLIGTHDFASMTRLHHGRESTVRTVHDCMVTRTGRRRLRVDICGDGFLHNMVRIIAGTLIEVGRRRMKPDEMERVLGARDRTAAGQTLPPEGLFLMWVKYA